MKNKIKEFMKDCLKAIFFSESAIVRLREEINFIVGIISLFVVSFVLSIPTEKASIGMTWIRDFAIDLVFVFGIICFVFLISVVFKSKTGFVPFFSEISFVFALSLVLVSAPIFIIAYFFVKGVLGYEILSLVLFSLVPYYNYILFGWACEVTSSLQGKRRIMIALVAMTLLFLFSYMMRYISA